MALNLPAAFRAGDTLKFTDSLPDYPASAGWALSYVITDASNRYTTTSSADGDDHLTEVAAATTANWVAGSYRWVAQVSKGAERYSVASGWITLQPDLLSAVDQRGHVERVIAAIESVIEGRAGKDALKMQMNGRSLERTPIADLLVLRDRYRAELRSLQQAERVANGQRPGNLIKVRF